jgi:caffeoyl-CoA O-methyltransferase
LQTLKDFKMEFIDAALDDYVCAHTSEETALLYELNRQTHLKILQPRMLSGHFQGRLLSMISQMIQPQRVLEIGTYTGYSALCLLEGLAPGGKITTIDRNEELEEFVRGYVAKAGAEAGIEYIVGDAMLLIPQMQEQFDLVFIDADKENYCNYYELVFDLVKPGGYILADNVLWSGKVVNDYETADRDTRILMDYNRMVNEDPRVENILLPIRDGLMLARKK